MRRILDTNIFVGNWKDTYELQALRDNNIKVIYNVCSDINTPYHPDIQLVKFGLDDPIDGLAPDNDLWLAPHLLMNCINVARQRKGNVLIHCYAGNNRAPLVAAIWLHMYIGYDIKEAVKITGVKECKEWMKAKGYCWEVKE